MSYEVDHMTHLKILLLFVLLCLSDAQAQNAVRDARADAAGNAQADSAAHEAAERRAIGAALWGLNAGVGAEDLQVVKAFLHADNDPKLALVEAHARRIMACKRFSDVAEKGLGKAAAGRLTLMDLCAFGMVLLAPTWDIQGTTAKPVAKEAARLADNNLVLPRLVNRRGVWKVDVTPAPTPTREEIEALAAAIGTYASMVDDAAAGIAQGRLKTIAEVENELKRLPQFSRPIEYTPDVVLALASKPPATTASMPQAK